MPKIRIHELAKELNIDNKKVMEYLKEKKIEVKSHMSTLEENQEAMVRKAFSSQPEKKEEREAPAEAPKKKSNIIQVFRPQNATSKEAKNYRRPGQKPRPSGSRPAGGERPVQEKAEGRPAGTAAGQPAAAARPQVAAQSAESRSIPNERPSAEQSSNERPAEDRQPKSQGDSAQRSYGDRNQGDRPQRSYGDRNQGDRPQRSYGDRNQGDRPQRSYGDRNQGDRPQRSYGDRNQGDRPQRPYGDRNQGDRPQRPYGDRNQGDRPQRPYGDRNQGDRPQRPYGDRNQGDRPQRPYGDRNQGDRPQRPYGDRNQGDRPQRPYGDRNQGDRPQRPYGDRNQGNRPGYAGQSRPGQGNRPGYAGQGRNDRKDGDNRGGFDNRSRGPRTDRDKKPETIDLGLKKPSRDTSHKDKDKNKDSLRENKFVSDRRGSGANRPNQGRRPNQNLPKALQKPAHKPREEKKEEIKEIILPEKMTIRELAEKMKLQPSVIVKKLFLDGIMVTVNQEIDFEKAQEIALGYDIIAEPEEKIDVIEELLKEEDEDESVLVPRPPVVCVMGHVDHGKTSLLDAIRDAHVTDREAGGITQHIGAYGVSINGQRITFLDTPGHEAFTAMRMRGANSTDIAVLVVAADDGVMPQTIEAINHAKAAGVEIIVAINKIDKPSANVDRVKQELSEYELIPEDWGGSTVFVPVSAKTHEGIDNLLEMILLTAEVLELKANPKRHARGLVLEAKLDKGKGPVANILVQKGTLHVGDYIAAGACSGKVRAMMDENSRRLKEAGPSTPVEVLGLNDVPNAGEILVATETDKEAKNFAATFVSEGKNRLLEDTKAKMSLDDLFSQIQEGNLKELNIVVKADVQGSVEAVKQSLVKLSNEEVVVKIVHGGVGAINESDVTLAAASNAIVIGFNVRPDVTAKAIAEQEGVDMRLYRVIYQAIEDVEAAMKGMLDPVFEEKVIGHAEIRQLFKASGVGTIAGSYVLDGIFQRGASVRITREGKQIFEGPLASLKRFKDDVKEVKTGYECGLVFDGFNDIQELDQVEAYIMVEVPR
ncbi:translation initiation factor IF-2 [Wansuia hejianensis]|uniref:Translation initiation factor IF-2 n=1 Tax=Wansuia hejianensis TaxID=2763667 RepID=A0A7G9GE33_9FIRM|nr:translation initiation factor IF-2 [Wansuia hejianensis]QNM09065.1 translation initiation factor IF-2 [Wansuia hejianensis]